jgi:tetratricopeptide (TPR) repeat protein
LKREVVNRTGEIPAALHQLLEVQRRSIPDDHPLSAVNAEYLKMWGGQCFYLAGPFDNNLSMYEEAERLARTSHFLHPWKLAGVVFDLAWALQLRGKYDKAEPLAREAVTILESQFGNRDQFSLNARSLLGATLYGQGRFSEAEPLLRQSYQDLLAALGPADRNTLIALDHLVDSYVVGGRPDEAANQIRQLFDQDSCSKQLDRASWQVAKHPGLPEVAYLVALAAAQRAISLDPEDGFILNTLGVVQYRLGRYSEAIQTLSRSNELSGGGNYADPVFLAMAHARLGHADEALRQLEITRSLLKSLGPAQALQANTLLKEAEATGPSP